MENVIVVCGTFQEWLNFRRWYGNKIIKSDVFGGSFEVSDSITYHCMIADGYNKMMGFDKYKTDVIRIGTWYENITEETEKFLSLFRFGDDT